MLSDAQKIRDGYLLGLGMTHVMAEIDLEEKKDLLSKSTEENHEWNKLQLDKATLTLKAVGLVMERVGKGLTPYGEGN
jgi:hypothetical protein